LIVKSIIKVGEYHDSVSLMLVARELSSLAGIHDAAVVMATEANKNLLAGSNLLTEEARAAQADDLVISVAGKDHSQVDAVLHLSEQLLLRRASAGERGGFKPKSIRSAVAAHPESNIAVISVAGRYAAGEAWEALRQDLHVLLFSDNVSLEDEIALKRYARERGLLLMGPGAGTAILNNVGLGFANAVPPGPAGIVSAAGTGLQEVSSLLARQGIGISQGIGTGGRDLKAEVGGLMMLEGLKALQSDANTEVIVLISKPPAPGVVETIVGQITAGETPTVVCFLGGDMRPLGGVTGVLPARTLREAAWLVLQALGMELGSLDDLLEAEDLRLRAQAKSLTKELNSEQRYLRGIFSGGTLCYEAQVIWRETLTEPVYANAPLPGNRPLSKVENGQGHTAVDYGEEEYTVGRPHPMIDNDLRIRRILQVAQDPQAAVVMLDVVLGYGAHPDPAAELGQAIEKARNLAAKEERELLFVASVTGTDADPQNYARQATSLERAGAIVCQSNAEAARLAALIVERE